MKFIVQKEIIQKGISAVQNAVAVKSSLPILSNLLFEAEKDSLKISAMDFDIMGISTVINAEIVEDGSGTLPAKRIGDIVRELSSENITITKKKNTFSLESGSSIFKIIGLPKEDFPQFPQIKSQNKIIMPQNILKQSLEKTIFAISHDETRYVLNGLLISLEGNKIDFVATDGRRMAWKTYSMEQEQKITAKAIIPAKTALELQRNLKENGDVEITLDENQIFFKMNETNIISRLIEGEYPDYKQVVPKEKGSIIEVDKNSLFSSVKRASILSTVESVACKMELNENRMIISKITPEIGEFSDEINAQYDGALLDIGFNPNYLLDVLKVLDGDSIQIENSGPSKPILFKEQDYLHMVLPMQI